MKAYEQGNDWLKLWNENQRSLFQAWAEGKPSPFAMQGEPPPGTEVMSDLLKRSMEEWAALAKGAWPRGGKFDAAAMRKLFDPEEWKRAGSHFDVGLEKLTEGPTYATLWDLDKKMLNVQKLWVERARDVEGYWEVVQGAWNRATERFMKAVNDPKASPLKSGRDMLDLWLATANQALLEMHRSKEFLEAQRRMTRSSTEYRLAEREIAEAFCEMHHIPTRTEVDELGRTIVELKREIRALKRAARPAGAAKPGRKK
jgi:hypothetical protein